MPLGMLALSPHQPSCLHHLVSELLAKLTAASVCLPFFLDWPACACHTLWDLVPMKEPGVVPLIIIGGSGCWQEANKFDPSPQCGQPFVTSCSKPVRALHYCTENE